MNILRTCLVIGAFAIATCVSLEGAELIYFDEDGGSGNPRALYDFNSISGVSTLRATVGGSQRFFSMARRPSDGTVFAAEVVTGDALWTIDIDTGATSFVVTHGVPTVGDITFDPVSGTLYGLTRNSPYSLYTIDPATGASTFIGNTSNSVRTGLTYSPSGVLYGFTLTGTLYTIDPSNANTTLVGGSGAPVGLIEDADFTPAGELFVAGWDGSLLQVDPATGSRTLVGTTGMGSGLTAVLGIPEPSTALLLGFGAVAFLKRRRTI